MQLLHCMHGTFFCMLIQSTNILCIWKVSVTFVAGGTAGVLGYWVTVSQSLQESSESLCLFSDSNKGVSSLIPTQDTDKVQYGRV